MKNTTLTLTMCLIAAFAVFTLPVDAATVRTHEINFDMMVPCVGEKVHLSGPFKVSLAFTGKSLTNTEVIGRSEANPGNVIRFWAKQIVRLEFGKTLAVDFEALKVCVTP